MRQLRKISRARRDSGASAVEYGLLIAGILLGVLGVIFFFGGTAQSLFEHNVTCIDSRGEIC